MGHLGTLLFSSPSFIPRAYVERGRNPHEVEYGCYQREGLGGCPWIHE